LGYESLGVFDNGEQALEYLAHSPADILVCDIALKGKLTGLDVGKWASEQDIPLVFVTSFLDDATFKKARTLGPSAFLTKPFKSTDLQRAMELAALEIEKRAKRQPKEKALFIKHKYRLIKINSSDIILIVSDGNYATFVTEKGRFVVKRSLRQVMERLPEDVFIRVHRSYVIKFDSITDVFPESQEVSIGKERIPIGRSYKAALMDKLEIL
jgi:DNA-binding LytR/AlgR family response regulator